MDVRAFLGAADLFRGGLIKQAQSAFDKACSARITESSTGGADGLPIGLQLVSKPFSESLLLRVAQTYQDSTTWHIRRPKL